MEPPYSLLLLVLLSAAGADRKIGCLFESELCEDYEICINDAVFGRCQSPPVTGAYTYDITAPLIQRLRTLLQKLSHRGLTWEDETTQQVLSREFSKLQKIPLTSPEATKSRMMDQAVATGDQRLKSSHAEFSKSLQKYLQNMGFIPKSKSDRIHNNGPLNYYHPDKASPPNLLSDEPQDGTLLLMAALQQYLDQTAPSWQKEDQAAGDASHLYSPFSRLRPTRSNDMDTESNFENQQPALEADKAHRTNVERLFLKAKMSPAAAKDPLTPIDETFIQNVLRNVGRHNVDVESLGPEELNQLAGLITDALPAVEQPGFRKKDRALDDQEEPAEEQLYQETGDSDLYQDQEEDQEQTAADQPSEGEVVEVPPTQPSSTQHPPAEERRHEEERSTDDRGVVLLGKLLEYLDRTALSDGPPSSQLRGVRGQGVSVEMVHSRVTQKKAAPLERVAEVQQLQGWISEEKLVPPAASETKHAPAQELQLDVQSNAATRGRKEDDSYGYIITDTEALPTDEGLQLMEILARRAKIQITDFLELSFVGPAVIFRIRSNAQNISTEDVANVAVRQKDALEKEAKLKILEAGVTDKSKLKQLPTKYSKAESTKFLILTVISLVCIAGVLLASAVVYCLRHRSHHKLKEKLTNLGTDPTTDTTATYQELCRQRMAVKPPVERAESRLNSVSSQLSDGQMTSPSARASISSWSEEPAHSNMDISTGHMILSYMEDHLKNKDRLEREWEGLCAYQAEPNATTIGLRDSNTKKNRSSTVVAYDHSRIKLRIENSQGNSDYINASPIMDHDPRFPAYIATQGPLPSTVADFWQMVWESGCVVIVMLTPLSEGGVKQCYHYWPDEGSNLYHIYEVNLVSEHVWCEDFLVRSFYLKNMQTNETRTVTQFNYHTWLNQSVPESSQALLDFRRKVNKCYRGRSCPVIVHCSDGAGRTGTYILIDMVLNKMAKGAKEIDIAATLEHLRDQRPCMVQTKEQFQFALTAVAEEVNAILKALPQ
ncbi:receptor-type tyrosine-protein phosphatase N2-like [Denticeps clupeoides]|uniref:Receptor-type tyrosine-protein phosphatase N2-like n=1 Tax=Denticeps clupeoides TaxID=299321 RepID=A0AAY4A6V1_9TELE|nr:receptor-type tyrosine-protein phosphatase N2-like [Denticeps clupeoides]